MWYVNILESEKHNGKFYNGFKSDLDKRIQDHNSDQNTGHTSKYKPRKLYAYMAFSDKNTAQNFELYFLSCI